MIALRQGQPEDADLLWKMVRHPSIWNSVSPDNFTDLKVAPPLPGLLWLIVELDGKPVGFWAFTYRWQTCWDLHVGLLPVARAKKNSNLSDEIFQAMLQWVRENTVIRRLVAEIPNYNRAAIQYALRNGMSEYGRNPECWLKNGKLWDTVLVGMKIER